MGSGVGTTRYPARYHLLSSDFPFAFHLYHLYPAGEGGSPQATVRPPTRRRSNVDAGRRSAKPNLSWPSSGCQVGAVPAPGYGTGLGSGAQEKRSSTAVTQQRDAK